MTHQALTRPSKRTQKPVSGPPATESRPARSVEQLCGASGFLVLTRRKGEDIVIEVGDLVILVRQIDISRSNSRIGIMASKKARILRREVFELIQNEK